MKDNARRRGRPKGTGLKDGTKLEKMADIIVANQATTVTGAIRQVVVNPNLAEIRRFQRKWRELKLALLADARLRAKPRRAHQAQATYSSARYGVPVRPAWLDVVEQFTNNPVLKYIRDIENSPAVRMAKEYEELALAAKRICQAELQATALARVARQHEEAVRQLRFIQGF